MSFRASMKRWSDAELESVLEYEAEQVGAVLKEILRRAKEREQATDVQYLVDATVTVEVKTGYGNEAECRVEFGTREKP